MNKKSKNVLLLVVLIAIIGIAVGYAALSQNLVLNGTATVKGASDWKVHFAEGTVANADAHGVTDPKISLATDKLTGTFSATLEPGASVSYRVTVVNEGTIGAEYNGFAVNENNANDYVPQNEEQPENDIMLEEENQIDLDLELEAQEKAQETSQITPFASNISDPQGLFSKFTGLGWESYLETRLDSELGRAASAEQDLAFFLIAIENFNFQNQIIPHLTSILLEKFKFRDLVFEYGTNGFAAIVQGMNLDRAMALTQELYTDISGLLVNYQMNNKFGIGITTRSLRLITGNRLIDEAQQALNKAFDEEGLPIVAFRVNPEKYRQCLADNE